MTFLELQNLVASWVDDVNFGYFTTTQVKTFLNNAQREVQKHLLQSGENYYVVSSQTTLVADQTEYVLPSDFLKLHRLEIVTSGSGVNEVTLKLNALSINERDQYAIGNGTPQGYYIKKNRVVLAPAPASALTMRMWYSPRVTDLSGDSETPDVPADYHEYLAILAAIDCFLKDGRDPGVLLRKQQYYLDLMKQNADDRRQDEPRHIIETDDWYGPQF